MNASITKQDRKNAKNTCMILAVLLAICIVFATIFGIAIPVSRQLSGVGANNEEIKSQINGKDGSDYFLLTDYSIYRFDALTDEMISTFSLSEIQNKLQEQGDFDRLVPGSLNQWGVKYVEGLETDSYIVYDGNGNLFKLTDDGVQLHMTDDYYLSEKKDVVKGCDNLGGNMYVLTLTNSNHYYVRQFDFNNLSNGIQKAKMLWDLDLSGEMAGYTKISPMSASTGIFGFIIAEDVMYIFRDGGSIIKLGLDMVDCMVDGAPFDYFTTADEYYSVHYQEVYDKTYADYFRNLLLNLEENTYTEEQLNAATIDELVSYYGEYKSSTTVNKAKTSAKKAAEQAAADGFTAANEWCGGYDRATKSIFVSDTYMDKQQYSVIYSGESAINGIVYSKKNKTAYYTNASDGYLYSVEKADIDNAGVGSFLSDIATRIDAVSCGKGRKFSSFGNGLGINEFANTLYLKFENERTISIVDINDKENYHIQYTFEGGFDVYSLTGDKDNKVTHVLRQVSKVSLKGITTTKLYSCTYNPASFQQKGLIKTLFILFLALSVLTLAGTVWFYMATKSDRTLYKAKSIQRDFKRNKWVYISLIFFIVLLIMFCYYEAIGAISMSFFDYTREKPAWIWNNFGNYLRIVNQPDFFLSIKNMLFFLCSDLILGIIPSLTFAFLLTIIRNKTLSNWVRSLMFIPGIIPGMATMLIWREGIYGTDGAFNQLLGLFGNEPIAWLDNIDYARWSLIFMGFPFVGGYLIFYGGMMNIPSEYHEAGRLEGLGIVRQFISIDIPLIAPQIKYVFITIFISSVQNYARTYILGSSGTVTPVENMYRIMTGTQADYGMASAYATILFIFLFAAVATNFKMQRKDTMGEDL